VQLSSGAIIAIVLLGLLLLVGASALTLLCRRRAHLDITPAKGLRRDVLRQEFSFLKTKHSIFSRLPSFHEPFDVVKPQSPEPAHTHSTPRWTPSSLLCSPTTTISPPPSYKSARGSTFVINIRPLPEPPRAALGVMDRRGLAAMDV